MVRKEPSPKAGCVRVSFELPASLWADKVYLAGDFNNWQPRASPLQRMRNGVWSISLDLPARRCYRYRYLIDDHWSSDFHAIGYLESNLQGHDSYVETTLPLENLATLTGHGMVHEAAIDRGTNFVKKR